MICSDVRAADPSPASADETDRVDGWGRAPLDQQLAELGRLAAMGMDVASEIHRRVMERIR